MDGWMDGVMGYSVYIVAFFSHQYSKGAFGWEVVDGGVGFDFQVSPQRS